MKVKIFLFLILLMPFFVSASSVVEVNYDNFTETYQSTESSSVLIKLYTTEDANCRYSFSDTIYSNMNEFYITGGIEHRQTLSELDDGNNQIYFNCKYNSIEHGKIELNLDVNSLITASIDLSENSPIPSGNININLETSKVVNNPPTLTYLINGEDKKNIPLEGSGDEWEGSIYIDDSIGEGVLSFEFSAKDLEGREGTKITSGKSFEIDTISPTKIIDWEIIPDEDKIKLSWYMEEDYHKIKIYRATYSGATSTLVYKSTSKSYYIDKYVDEGETYYYKIAAVDEAGNEGPMSVEKFSTPLSSEDSSEDLSLSPVMISKINTFLSNLNSKYNSMKSSSVSETDLNEDEKEILSILGLEKTPNELLLELNSIKNTVENYKTQEMSEETLLSKLDSQEMKIMVIEKEFPVSIKIEKEESKPNEISKEDISSAIYKKEQSMSENENDKNTENTLRLIEERGLEIKSKYYLVKVEYYDTSTEEYSIVKRDLSSTLDLYDNGTFLEIFPSALYENMDEFQFVNKNVNKLSEKEMFSFDSSTKEIKYFAYGDIFNSIQEIKPIFIVISKEETNTKTSITGYTILNSSIENRFVIVFSLFIFLLLSYFFFLKNKNIKKDYSTINNEIKHLDSLVKQKDFQSAKNKYKNLQDNYTSLSENEKKKVYPKLENANTKILIKEFETELIKIKESKDKISFSALEEKYAKLPNEIKSKISPLFFKIKKEVLDKWIFYIL